MPIVLHKNYGSSTSAEAKAAEALKLQLEKLPCDGSILIASNVTLPGGYGVKDLDIVVSGYLTNFFIEDFEYPRNFKGYRADKKGLQVQAFLVVIELKNFDIEQIDVTDFGVITGKYANGDDSTPTLQNFNQKYALRNALRFYRHIEPYTYHLVWLNSIEKQDFIDRYGDHEEWNILVGDVDGYDFFRTVAFNGECAIWKDDCYLINSFDKPSTCDEVMSVFEFFLKCKTSMGNLTRHKLEAISERSADFETTICPERITVLKGRAGTGKTIRLLQFARKQISEGKKCVLLTFNHALVSDIRRLIAFSDWTPEESSNLFIITMIQFFSDMMSQNGISNTYVDDDFEQTYVSRMESLKQKIESVRHTPMWDFVLVDEAQDWSSVEINVLLSIFKPEQIVIADGIDQFVRSSINSWERININKHLFSKSLRQKSNLVAFANAFAESAGLTHWKIEENPDLKGGRVIITPSISLDLLQQIKSECLAKGNAMYDILFLAPSAMTRSEYITPFLSTLKKKGLPLFDGTKKENREFYSINVDEGRIFNYNSCRGIEGWTVGCLYLDLLIEEKLQTTAFPPLQPGESEYDRQVRIWKQVCMWILMPLTRAIDTLVITLRDTNSKIGQLFRELSKKHNFVQWEFKN